MRPLATSAPLELATAMVADWEQRYGTVNPRVRGHLCLVFTQDVRAPQVDDGRVDVEFARIGGDPIARIEFTDAEMAKIAALKQDGKR